MTEWNAGEYVKRSGLQAAMAEEALGLLKLTGRERVLDVGCGDGRITAEIAARLPQGEVVGVDASRAMVAFAEERFREPLKGFSADPEGTGFAKMPPEKTNPTGERNLSFSVADARYLPFSDAFDLVVSFNALHWIPEQELALQSIRRALRLGAHAQIRLVPRGRRQSLEDVLEETRLSDRWSAYFAGFHDPYLHLAPEEHSALAERNGLSVLSLHTEAKSWNFESRAAFFAFGSVTFVEWTRLLPEAEKPEFINNVLDRYRIVACDRPGEENVFKFYQMDITLRRA